MPIRRRINYHLVETKMPKNLIIISLIIIIIASAIWASFGVSQKLHALADTQSSLAAEQSRSLALATSLASTETQLKTVETVLSVKKVELDKNQDTLAGAVDYLTITQSQLEYSKYQLNQVREQLATTQGQLTTALNDTNTGKDEAKSPRPFNSVPEAQAWLDQNHLPAVLIADPNGAINFSQPQADSRYDCDDYARDYQQLALKSGYIINLCPVIYGRVWGITVSNLLEAHIGNWVQIDNIYYYIESVPGLDNSYQLTRITSAD